MNLGLAAHPSRGRTLAGAILLSFLLATIDYLTGPQFSFTIFYLFPVALVAWTVGRRAAILLSLGCALLWSLADLETFHGPLPVALNVWNALVRVLFFLIVSATLATAREALERESKLARSVQRRLVPTTFPDFPGIDIAAVYLPARTLSGDYFDVLRGGDGRLVVCIADVAGKGTGPALLMANLQAAVRVLAPTGVAPADLCQKLNRFLHGNLQANSFITLFVGMLDLRGGRFRYANAGHNPPLLVRATGERSRLTEGGMVLGIDPHQTYGQGEAHVAQGDRIVFYTDGLVEVTDRDGNEYGERRLSELAAKCAGSSARAFQSRLIGDVESFKNGEFSDDVSLVVIAVEQTA